MKLGFLDKLRERQEPRARYSREKSRIVFGEGFEFGKVPVEFGAQIVSVFKNLRNAAYHPVFPTEGSPPNPVCQQ